MKQAVSKSRNKLNLILRNVVFRHGWSGLGRQRNKSSLPFMLVISACGSPGNFSVSTLLRQELGDHVELEGISKLEYLMRTNRHNNSGQSESNPNAGGQLGRFYFF